METSLSGSSFLGPQGIVPFSSVLQNPCIFNTFSEYRLNPNRTSSFLKSRYFIPTAKLICFKLSTSRKCTLSVSTPIRVGVSNVRHESLDIIAFNDVSHATTGASTQILTISFFSTSSQSSLRKELRLTLNVLWILFSGIFSKFFLGLTPSTGFFSKIGPWNLFASPTSVAWSKLSLYAPRLSPCLS